jgi:glutathione S-transferase
MLTEQLNALPILYSFRRCPYAMRARMAIRYSQIEVELREVKLSQKPGEMLVLSEKGTVPVLVLENGTVLEESMDIIHWALSIDDNDNWKLTDQSDQYHEAMTLISENDTDFKNHLDRYKYADRNPNHPVEYYRNQGEPFLAKLNQLLSRRLYLITGQISIADIAIFPFIRQFAYVDKDWFNNSDYQYLVNWTLKLIETTLFQSAMKKQNPWNPLDPPFVF